MELYIIGIVEGAVSNRAGSIALVFYGSVSLCSIYFNLIPYIPIEGFQQDFLKFVSEGVPNTYYAIENIVNDILHNSNPVYCRRVLFYQFSDG
jgi:membrane protein